MTARESEAGDRGLNAQTLESLYAEMEKPLFNVLFRWLWNAADAQDVAQEAFLRVWRIRHRVEIATVKPLIYRTALNIAANKRRTQRLFRWISLDAAQDSQMDTPSPDESMEGQQAQTAIRAAVERLPEPLKRVVMLCEFSQLSYAEIAAALGIPIGTVGSRRNAALKLLHREVSREFA